MKVFSRTYSVGYLFPLIFLLGMLAGMLAPGSHSDCPRYVEKVAETEKLEQEKQEWINRYFDEDKKIKVAVMGWVAEIMKLEKENKKLREELEKLKEGKNVPAPKVNQGKDAKIKGDIS